MEEGMTRTHHRGGVALLGSGALVGAAAEGEPADSATRCPPEASGGSGCTGCGPRNDVPIPTRRDVDGRSGLLREEGAAATDIGCPNILETTRILSSSLARPSAHSERGTITRGPGLRAHGPTTRVSELAITGGPGTATARRRGTEGSPTTATPRLSDQGHHPASGVRCRYWSARSLESLSSPCLRSARSPIAEGQSWLHGLQIGRRTMRSDTSRTTRKPTGARPGGMGAHDGHAGHRRHHDRHRHHAASPPMGAPMGTQRSRRPARPNGRRTMAPTHGWSTYEPVTSRGFRGPSPGPLRLLLLGLAGRLEDRVHRPGWQQRRRRAGAVRGDGRRRGRQRPPAGRRGRTRRDEGQAAVVSRRHGRSSTSGRATGRWWSSTSPLAWSLRSPMGAVASTRSRRSARTGAPSCSLGITTVPPALWTVPATGGRESVLIEPGAYGTYSPGGGTIAYTWVGTDRYEDPARQRRRRSSQARTERVPGHHDGFLDRCAGTIARGVVARRDEDRRLSSWTGAPVVVADLRTGLTHGRSPGGNPSGSTVTR